MPTGISTSNGTSDASTRLDRRSKVATPKWFSSNLQAVGDLVGSSYNSIVAHRISTAMDKPLIIRSSRFPRGSHIAVFASDNCLREALIRTLSEEDVESDSWCDYRRMLHGQPIEDASIEWRESETPYISVARIFIPKQKMNSQAQLAFADVISINP